MVPIEAWIVGAGAALIATGLLVAFVPAMLRRPYPDDEPEPEDFVPATVSPGHTRRTVPAWGDLVRPAAPPGLPPRPDSDTRVLYVVPALCGCEDGGIGHLLDKTNPYCRRCGGAR